MPKIGSASSRSEELTVRRRLEWELRRRKLSYAALAARLTESGHPTNPSAIHKLLHAQPRRRITVNELAALADVFEIPIPELLTAQDVLLDERANELLKELEEGANQLSAPLSQYKAALDKISAYVEDGDLMAEAVEETMADLEKAMAAVGSLYETAVDRIYGIDDYEAGNSNPSALSPRKVRHGEGFDRGPPRSRGDEPGYYEAIEAKIASAPQPRG